ncbi:AEC family transporter [Sulfurimonas sp.]|uniref:AEC family transporter n=1 Tax=Sulfurimonas sp. TaxID=2022749 RepID=UPI0025DB2454|nr:AEC family transporter [Sulfurimonas sp.]
MTIINTLIPIFFLIMLGYTFKHLKFPHEDFWKYLDKLNYFVLFPSLLVYKLSTANIQNINGFDFVLTAFISIFILSFLLIVYNKIFTFEASSFTSIFQGAIRFNTYVLLALVDAYMGDEGLVLALFLMTFVIPLLNILCISIFSIYVPNDKVTPLSFIKSVLYNPLIIACISGGALNFFSIDLPLVMQSTLSIMSSAALPLGLLSVGVGLHLSSLRETKSALFVSSILKLIIFPFIIMGVSYMIGLDKTQTTVLVLFASLPTASSAYVLARELGGDLKLISSIISLQTLLSAVSIFVFLKLVDILL